MSQECKHEDTIVSKDIGFDIYTSEEGGLIEVKQHLEKCFSCGKERLISDFIINCLDGGCKEEKHIGKWVTPSEEMY